MLDPRPDANRGPRCKLIFRCFPLWGHPIKRGSTRTVGRRGFRILPTTYKADRSGRPHLSFDITADEGTAIVSPVGAIVRRVGADKLGGNAISLVAGGGDYVFALYFAHLTTPVRGLRAGDRVFPGHLLGLVGSTGHSSGPHLHIQVTQKRGTQASVDRQDRVDPGAQLFKFLEPADAPNEYRLTKEAVVNQSSLIGIHKSPAAYNAFIEKMVSDRYGRRIIY